MSEHLTSKQKDFDIVYNWLAKELEIDNTSVGLNEAIDALERMKTSKVYAVILDEVYDGEACESRVWIFADRAGAEKKLAELDKIGGENDHFDCSERELKDYVDYWLDGWYNRWHFHARIEERKIHYEYE